MHALELSSCASATTMATSRVVPLDASVRAVIDQHKLWLPSTTFRPSGSTTEICSNDSEMQTYGEGLVHEFRSQYWKVHLDMLLQRDADVQQIDHNDQPIGERKVLAFRFTSEADLLVDPGWSFDIIPVSGPILVNNALVNVGFYGHIDQASRLKAVSPPRDAVRHCWLYMNRVDG